MRKYSDHLNIYILVKILFTFVPVICIFGVYTIPFSISFALSLLFNYDVVNLIMWLLILISLLWIPFLVMSFINKEKVRRIARHGVIALSCLEIVCLLISFIAVFRSYRFFYLHREYYIWYLLFTVALRLAAIAENICCIVFCIKLNSKSKVNDELDLQPSTDSQE